MDTIDRVVRALYRVSLKDREALLTVTHGDVLQIIMQRHANRALDYRTIVPAAAAEVWQRAEASNRLDAERNAAEGRCDACLRDDRPLDEETGLCPGCWTALDEIRGGQG